MNTKVQSWGQEKERKMKKKNEAIKKSAFSKFMSRIKPSHCVLLLIICFITYKCGIKTYENYQIDNEGVLIFGQIYDKQLMNRTTRQYYRFRVNGDYYYGDTGYDQNLQIGNQILIKYNKSNPTQNESYSAIKSLSFRKKANIERDSIWIKEQSKRR